MTLVCVEIEVNANRDCCPLKGSGCVVAHVRIQRGGGRDRGSGPPLKNDKNIGSLSNTGPDPLKNHKATKPALNVVLSTARQRNAITMAFPWLANDVPLLLVFGSYLPSSTTRKPKQNTHKKTVVKVWTPSDKTFWIRACC